MLISWLFFILYFKRNSKVLGISKDLVIDIYYPAWNIWYESCLCARTETKCSTGKKCTYSVLPTCSVEKKVEKKSGLEVQEVLMFLNCLSDPQWLPTWQGLKNRCVSKLLLKYKIYVHHILYCTWDIQRWLVINMHWHYFWRNIQGCWH